MNNKTPNARRRTPNMKWLAVREDRGAYRSNAATPNAQRPTLHAQSKSEPLFDLEDRLLEFSARFIRLVDALPNYRAANHVAGQLLRCATSPLRLVARSSMMPAPKMAAILNETEELIKFFFSSVRAAERNAK